MNLFLDLFIAPLFFICGCMYLMLLAVAACLAARAFRWAQMRFRRAREARIPDYGTPLKPDEAYLLAAIRRGWKDTAAEPEYEDGGEW